MQDEVTRVIVAAVTGWYTPGYRAGGILRALVDLVERLGDEIDFRIITSDRDMHDTLPYPSVRVGHWQAVGRAQVLYVSPQQQRPVHWLRLLRRLRYDVLYLNSFFSHLTIKTLGYRRMGLLSRTPTIVAPHGEFSPGAIGLKAAKKRSFIVAAKRIGLYSDVVFQATSRLEERDIRGIFPKASIHLAPYALKPLPTDMAVLDKPAKRRGAARLIFLSRISRKKNVDFAIRCLLDIRGEIDFDVYGPIEDPAYWHECREQIKALPSNIRVRHYDEIEHSQVGEAFRRYHGLLFPTRAENFGYVTLEALKEGCVILTSDQTPWRHLRERCVGWDLPLSEPRRFTEAINDLVEMDSAEFERWSRAALQCAIETTNNPELLEANRRLFQQY